MVVTRSNFADYSKSLSSVWAEVHIVDFPEKLLAITKERLMIDVVLVVKPRKTSSPTREER